MPRKPRKESPHKLRPDVAETAYRVMQEAVGEAERTLPPGDRHEEQKNPEAVKRGAKGGEKGGKARAERLTREDRSEIARRAARIRWRKDDS